MREKGKNKSRELGIAPLFLVLLLAGLFVVGFGAWYLSENMKGPEPVFCTQDAKQCLDGSYVGRTGPKCEFASCPNASTTIDTSTWKTYRNDAYEFELKYPAEWEVAEDYSRAVDSVEINSLVMEKNGVEVQYGFLIQIYRFKEGTDFEKWIKDYFSTQKILKITHTYLNAYPAIETSVYNPESRMKGETLFLEHWGSIFVLGRSPYGESDQILSTFKFVEPKQQNTTIPNQRVYRNNEFGFSLFYSVDQLVNTENGSGPDISIDSTSTIRYDPVAYGQFGINLYRNLDKFSSYSANGLTGSFDELRYSAVKRQWAIDPWAFTPESATSSCPLKLFTSNQNVPYYAISTGFHAGASVEAYLTDKGMVILIGADYFSDADDKFYSDKIVFDNPKSVFSAECSIAVLKIQ